MNRHRFAWIAAGALAFGSAHAALGGEPEYNRYVPVEEIAYEPVPGGTGWQISAAIGFESLPDDVRDLSCTVSVALNGEVLMGGGSGGGIVHRIIVGPGIPFPGGPAICAEFCAIHCQGGAACGNMDFLMCMCVINENPGPPYGPGFRMVVPAPALVDGDVLTVSVAAAPMPEALPEIDTSDDLAMVVVTLPTPCPADFDQSGTVASADITAFLSAWFADLAGGTLTADFNGSGATTSADITAFLTAWFDAIAGGC